MSSTFFGLEIGRSALIAQQQALNVTGHNISNANTEGYSRQEAILTTSNPFTIPGYNRPTTPGQVGTGVQVDQIRRIRDSFIDAQVRTENKNLGYSTAKQDALSKVEVIVNEPSDSSLRSVLDQFWESWQELSKDPESLSVRSVVRQRGIAVAETIGHMDQLYSELQYDINDSIKTKVQDINSIATQIAEINKQILPIEAQGDKANDLRDRRDLLVDQMSKLADVKVWEGDSGQLNVTLGSRDMVRGGDTSLLETVGDPLNNGYVNVVWADDQKPVNLTSGEVLGMLESRGSYDAVAGKVVGLIPDMRRGLDDIAKNIVDTVNQVHSAGYDLMGNTGINFFKAFVAGVYPPVGKTYAQSIVLDSAIENSLGSIAAGSQAPDPGPVPIVGDGGIALGIAQLKQAKTMNLAVGMGTVDDYYRAQIGKLGVDSQEAQRMVDNQQTLVDQLDNKRQSLAGVSLDEEMTNMIKFQKGYEAAARVVTVMDEMLDKIINGMAV